jgi:prepilin-type N-terminal cleavage/methylation domain-containing protein
MWSRRYKGGFSLLEVLMAIILVGLAIATLVIANGSFTKGNAAGTELSTAEFLIEQIRELTVLLPVVDPESENATFGPEADETTLANYDDLDDFDGFDSSTLGAPINADRTLLNDFAPYVQQITVENVSATNFEQVVADNSIANPRYFFRVTVTVFLNSKEISSADWVRTWYEEQ